MPPAGGHLGRKASRAQGIECNAWCGMQGVRSLQQQGMQPSLQLGLEVAGRLRDMFQGLLAQGAPVAADTPLGAQVLVNFDRIFRRGVVVTHERARQICPNRDGRNRWRSQALPDLLEGRAQRCVAGKVKAAVGALNIPTAPQGPHPVQAGSSRPVLAGRGCDCNVAAGASPKFVALPPILAHISRTHEHSE